MRLARKPHDRQASSPPPPWPHSALLPDHQAGMSLIEVLIATAIFAIITLGIYEGLGKYVYTQKDLRASRRPLELDSFLKTNVWSQVAKYIKTTTCNTSQFSTYLPSGNWKVGQYGNGVLTTNPVHQNVAEQNAAAGRCANANASVSQTGHAFYFCFQFSRSGTITAPRDSIFYKLGTNAGDNTAFGEVWIGLRNATNLSNASITCNDFSTNANASYVAVIAYSLYYSQYHNGNDNWSHKKIDRVVYATRP